MYNLLRRRIVDFALSRVCTVVPLGLDSIATVPQQGFPGNSFHLSTPPCSKTYEQVHRLTIGLGTSGMVSCNFLPLSLGALADIPTSKASTHGQAPIVLPTLHHASCVPCRDVFLWTIHASGRTSDSHRRSTTLLLRPIQTRYVRSNTTLLPLNDDTSPTRIEYDSIGGHAPLCRGQCVRI